MTNMTASQREFNSATRLSILKFVEGCLEDGQQGVDFHQGKEDEEKVMYHNKLRSEEAEERQTDSAREKQMKDMKAAIVHQDFVFAQKKVESAEKKMKKELELLDMEKKHNASMYKSWEENTVDMEKLYVVERAKADAKMNSRKDKD